MKKTTLNLLAAIALMSSSVLLADEAGSAAQANNPLANMTAFNIHNYYIGDLTGSDEDANQVWLRYAKPFTIGESNWLLRASLPINTYPHNLIGGHETDVGDLNLFAAYMIDVGNPAISFGIGPQLTLPTATGGLIDSGKYSAGLVNVLFNASSPKYQYGYLLSWQGSFAGDDDKPDVNLAAFQPFLMIQMGEGVYLRSTPIMYKNFENDSYSIPVGFGAGKVLKRGKTMYNMFIEPQYSVADSGAGISKWQVFVGFNMQFMGP